MVIVLSNLEKRSFFSFLTLYIGSSFLLIIVIAILYFNTVSSSMYESQRDNMRTYASSIASKAIASHMYGDSFNYKNETAYTIGMYDNRFNILFGDEIKGIDFNKGIYQKEQALYVIDQSAHLHLGIKYIVLKNTELFNDTEKLKMQVILYTIIALIFVAIIGYFLSRLFLKPIANEREKLDKFIKDTTHELNTPISALLMSVSALKEEDSKVKERIKLSSTRISNIYDDLCYLLKDDIKTKLEVENINIKAVLQEQLLLLEGYAKSKRITIESSLNDTSFQMDSESSKRLISNILTNAMKYSKPNTIITITLTNRILIVKDQGVGIDEKNLSKIKTRYVRANSSEGGFGIGLDIVNSICQKYKINFTIESKKAVGTVVKLEF